jgi:hypothetical protein
VLFVHNNASCYNMLHTTCTHHSKISINPVGVAPVRYSLEKSATTPNVRQDSGLWGKHCYYKRTETISRCAHYIPGSMNRKGVYTLITLQQLPLSQKAGALGCYCHTMKRKKILTPHCYTLLLTPLLLLR